MSTRKKTGRKTKGRVSVRLDRLAPNHQRILAIQEAFKKRGDYAKTMPDTYEAAIERGAAELEKELNLIPA